MEVIISTTIKGIVDEVNKIGIKKEQIVTLVTESDRYILVYYEQ